MKRANNSSLQSGGGGLRLLFQPIVSLDGGAAALIETDLEIDDKKAGLIRSDEYFEIADMSRRAIGLWDVWLEKTAEAYVGFKERFTHDCIFVMRLSAKQLENKTDYPQMLKAIHYSDIPFRNLCFRLKISPGITDAFTQLRKLGAKIMLDDDYDRYGGLDLLSHYSFDFIRLHRRSINVIDDERAARVFAGYVEICRKFKTETVVSNVSDRGDIDRLKGLGVTLISGPAIKRPQRTITEKMLNFTNI